MLHELSRHTHGLVTQLARIETTRGKARHTRHKVRKVVILSLTVDNLQVVLTQSNSIAHQALVVELLCGSEVTQTSVVCDYQCRAAVQEVAPLSDRPNYGQTLLIGDAVVLLCSGQVATGVRHRSLYAILIQLSQTRTHGVVAAVGEQYPGFAEVWRCQHWRCGERGLHPF